MATVSHQSNHPLTCNHALHSERESQVVIMPLQQTFLNSPQGIESSVLHDDERRQFVGVEQHRRLEPLRLGSDHAPYRGRLVTAEVKSVAAQDTEIMHRLLLGTWRGGEGRGGEGRGGEGREGKGREGKGREGKGRGGEGRGGEGRGGEGRGGEERRGEERRGGGGRGGE